MWKIAGLIALVCASGFFSGVEAAFLALNPIRVKHLVTKRRKNADVIQELKAGTHRTITTLLIGNNLVNIAAAAIATDIAMGLFGDAGIAVATGVMTFLILVFGEIVPKSVCVVHSEKIMQSISPFIRFLGTIFSPIIWVLDLITLQIIEPLTKGKRKAEMTEEEIKSVLTFGEEAGAITKKEREMIYNVFRFDDTEVHQVMIPRAEMFVLDAEHHIQDEIDAIIKSGFSRIPVYEEQIDNIVGVIGVRDILGALKSGRNSKLKNIMKEAFFVPEYTKLNELLKKFQETHVHIAVIVDEHGSISGLVTVEDVLEELVGEIYDEWDIKKHPVKKMAANEYSVQGNASIPFLNKQIGIKIPMDPDIATLNGYILDQLGFIPEKGKVIDNTHFKIIVEDVDRKAVRRARIIKK